MPLYGRSAYAKCRNRILYFIFTIAFALAELIVYEYVISIIVRIRAGKFWHYTLLRLLLNPFRRIKRELHEIRLALLTNLSMTVKVTAVFLVVFLIEAFLYCVPERMAELSWSISSGKLWNTAYC